LRIGSVNVHSLRHPHEIAKMLLPHAPFDVLAVQEAPNMRPEKLHQLASMLGMKVHGPSQKVAFRVIPGRMQVSAVKGAAHSLDNAILVARTQQSTACSDETSDDHTAEEFVACHSGFHPPQLEARAKMRQTQRQERLQQPQVDCCFQEVAAVHSWHLETDMELRSAVAVELSPCRLVVCCTHLDAYKEAARVQQLQLLCPQLRAAAQGKGVVLIGDFNAVRRADYSPRSWEDLVERRSEAGIRTETAVTAKLETEWGFADCRALAEEAQGRVVTSCHEVRVDYAWVDAAVLKDWNVQRVCHIDLEDATDHSLLIADLHPRE